MQVLARRGYEVNAVDILRMHRKQLEKAGAMVISIANWFEVANRLTRPPPCIITNPPYSLAFEFVQSCWATGVRSMAMLLRLGFLESEKRHEWLSANPPSQFIVCSTRPSFTGDGNTDGTGYAWFIWESGSAIARHPKFIRRQDYEDEQ